MDKKTVSELKQICRDNDFKGYSKFTKKDDLLKFLDENLQKKTAENDAELAKIIYESEKEFYEKKQQENIEKQKKEEEEKKKILIQNEKIIKEKQNYEYKQSLKIDIENQEKEKMEKYKNERDKKYSQTIQGDELENLRKARLLKFSKNI